MDVAVDHGDAPWPYPDAHEVRKELDTEPSWACPQGVCECHTPTGEVDKLDHTLILYDETAEVMPDARCRVFEDGQLINEDPYADPNLGVVLRLKPTTRALFVEWAPHHVPLEPRYPYRRVYFVELPGKLEEGVRRRLHNLGFSSYPRLADNVRDFQRTYGSGPDDVTGRPEDITGQLGLFHDLTLLPPLDDKPGTST